MPKTATQVARATRGSPRKERSDMRCRQCLDLPLRSQCSHSPEGRVFMAEAATVEQEVQKSSERAQRAPPKCSKCLHRPLRSQCEHTIAGRAYLLRQAIELEVNSRMPTIPFLPTLSTTGTHLTTLTTNPEARENQMTVATGSSTTNPTATDLTTLTTNPEDRENPIPAAAGPSTTNPQARQVPIDPILLELHPENRLGIDHVDPSTPSRKSITPNLMATDTTSLHSGNQFEDTYQFDDTFNSSPETRSTMSPPAIFSSPVSMIDGVSSPSSAFPSSSPCPKSKKKYMRATKKNPIYKHVKGVMRGSSEHVIVRRHPRPLPLVDTKAGSAAFLRRVNRLIERAEDLYSETGCWIFVGAQHPGANGHTIHYTSPRLRRDAPNEMDDIINDYHQLMTSLLQSRRSDALEIAKECQKAKEDGARMASRVQSLEAQLGDMRDILENYAARLGLGSVA